MRTLPLHVFIAAWMASLSLPATAQFLSEPVGFIKVNANASSDLALSFPLQRDPILQATVVSVVNNTLVISASLDEDGLVYSTGVQPNHYFIRVHKASSDSGALNGTWYSIVANTASTGAPPLSQLTVEPDGPQSLQARGLAVGDNIEVIPFWTLNTLFPNGGGLTATSDLDAPKDRIVFYSQEYIGVNQAGAGVHIYNTSSLLPVGWHNNGTFASTGDLPIPPDVFVNVRNMGSQKSLVLTGRVPIRTCATTLATMAANTPQDNIVGNPFPIPVSLHDSNLMQSGAFTPTSDIDAPKDLLMLFKPAQVGHNIQPSHTYFYSTDPELGTGWFHLGTLDGPVDRTEHLLPGYGAIIRKAGGSIQAHVWPVPPPY